MAACWLKTEQLCKLVAQRCGESEEVVGRVLGACQDVVLEQINAGMSVRFGFGYFRLKTRAATKRRHRVTKEIIDVPVKQKPVFCLTRQPRD